MEEGVPGGEGSPVGGPKINIVSRRECGEEREDLKEIEFNTHIRITNKATV